jgi:uncharacterized LabA/DUF88 family protein
LIRFSLFVDGSNLFGTLKELDLRVDDYEAFYTRIFSDVVDQWSHTVQGPAPSTRLVRVYWYVVGAIDEWDLADPKTVVHLKERFDANKDLKNHYLPLAGKKLSGETQAKIEDEAWAMCVADFKEWYEARVRTLDGMRRFHFGVRRSTNFIDIVECGHWKVNFADRTLSEKGLDSTLAVDLVAQMDSYDVAVVISGDADSIPSINHVKQESKQVVAVEFVGGYPPEKKGRGFSSRLKLSADLVVRFYEADLVTAGVVKKGIAELAADELEAED